MSNSVRQGNLFSLCQSDIFLLLIYYSRNLFIQHGYTNMKISYSQLIRVIKLLFYTDSITSHKIEFIPMIVKLTIVSLIVQLWFLIVVYGKRKDIYWVVPHESVSNENCEPQQKLLPHADRVTKGTEIPCVYVQITQLGQRREPPKTKSKYKENLE